MHSASVKQLVLCRCMTLEPSHSLQRVGPTEELAAVGVATLVRLYLTDRDSTSAKSVCTHATTSLFGHLTFSPVCRRACLFRSYRLANVR